MMENAFYQHSFQKVEKLKLESWDLVALGKSFTEKAEVDTALQVTEGRGPSELTNGGGWGWGPCAERVAFILSPGSGQGQGRGH